MRCSVCRQVVGESVVTITLYSGLTTTMTLCFHCQRTLWGDTGCERVRILAEQVGWKRPRLPEF